MLVAHMNEIIKQQKSKSLDFSPELGVRQTWDQTLFCQLLTR